MVCPGVGGGGNVGGSLSPPGGGGRVIASRWVQKESNLMFTWSSNKD